MYPTIVIVLVETQRSMTDIYEISTPNTSRLAGPVASEARAATLRHPSFGVLNITMDNEAESLPFRTLQSGGAQERGLGKVILEVNFKESQVRTGS